MANESFSEDVVFTQKGIEDIEARVESLFKEIEQARRGQEAFTDALTSPAFAESVKQLDALKRKNQELAAAQQHTARTAERTQGVFSGDHLRRLREEVRVKEELRRVERLEQADRLRVRREEVAGGSVFAEAKQRLADAREEAKVRQMERREERRAVLEDRFGKRGGAMVGAVEHAAGSRAGGLALGGAGLAGGFVWHNARQGMEGTAELAALSSEIKLAQRSLAGSFRPALEAAAYSTARVRRVLDGLTAGEQNVLMAGTFASLIAGGGLAARMANNIAQRTMGVGLGTLALGGGGAGAGGSMLAQAAGSYAGARRVGGRLANKFGGVGPLAVGTAMAAYAASDASASEPIYKLYREAGYSKLGSSGRGFLTWGGESLGLNQLTGEDRRAELRSQKMRSLNDPSMDENFYRLRREAGYSKAGSAFWYGLDSFSEFGGGDLRSHLTGEDMRERLRRQKTRSIDFGNQKLSASGGGFEDVGEGYSRIVGTRDTLTLSEYANADAPAEGVPVAKAGGGTKPPEPDAITAPTASRGADSQQMAIALEAIKAATEQMVRLLSEDTGSREKRKPA